MSCGNSILNAERIEKSFVVNTSTGTARDKLFDIRASTLVSHIEVVHISRDFNGLTDQLAKNAAARHWEPVYSGG